MLNACVDLRDNVKSRSLSINSRRKVQVFLSSSIFSERLEIIIKEFNLDKASLAKAGGVKPQTVSGYLHDGRLPNQRTLELWLREFNIEGNWLLTGEGDMIRKEEGHDHVVLRMREAERLIKEHGDIGLEIVRLTLGTSDETSKSDPGVGDEKIASGY